MSYSTNGLHSRLDEEDDLEMVCDSQGSSGYQDLLQKRMPDRRELSETATVLWATAR